MKTGNVLIVIQAILMLITLVILIDGLIKLPVISSPSIVIRAASCFVTIFSFSNTFYNYKFKNNNYDFY